MLVPTSLSFYVYNTTSYTRLLSAVNASYAKENVIYIYIHRPGLLCKNLSVCIFAFYKLCLFVFYSTPAPGYFNDDDVIDFMVHWSVGAWPFYNTTDVSKCSSK